MDLSPTTLIALETIALFLLIYCIIKLKNAEIGKLKTNIHLGLAIIAASTLTYGLLYFFTQLI
jgi:hypothetical protein